MIYTIKTKRPQEFIDVTGMISDAVSKSSVQNGIAAIFVPHTTAGITINENADPNVVRDILNSLNKAYPVEGDYMHSEGNSHAHIKASLMGSSCMVLIRDGSLVLGTWQGIYFCEFDGPRNRKLFVKIIKD